MAAPSFVPVLTTVEGSALTVADWESIGVKTASYHLDSLLMKPGLTLLSELSSLAEFVGWRGRLVINAANMVINAAGICTIRSIYDGSTRRYTADQIFMLIEILQPNILILPRGAVFSAWERLSKKMDVFVLFDDAASVPHQTCLSGIFVPYQEETFSLPAFLNKRALYPHLPCYVAGDMSYSVQCALFMQGIEWIETNRPATDAMQGIVYCSEGAYAINDPIMTMAFSALDETCSCPTCVSKLTRAYLHHLYEQTPGLCQRFLLMHNAIFLG